LLAIVAFREYQFLLNLQLKEVVLYGFVDLLYPNPATRDGPMTDVEKCLWVFKPSAQAFRLYLQTRELVWYVSRVFTSHSSGTERRPPGVQTAVPRAHCENYPHKEIADLLGIAEGSSKAQYHRARLLLRGYLSEN
jgi:hypothetical protein